VQAALPRRQQRGKAATPPQPSRPAASFAPESKEASHRREGGHSHSVRRRRWSGRRTREGGHEYGERPGGPRRGKRKYSAKRKIGPSLCREMTSSTIRVPTFFPVRAGERGKILVVFPAPQTRLPHATSVGRASKRARTRVTAVRRQRRRAFRPARHRSPRPSAQASAVRPCDAVCSGDFRSPNFE